MENGTIFVYLNAFVVSMSLRSEIVYLIYMIWSALQVKIEFSYIATDIFVDLIRKYSP